jgi:hypothetical protein
MKMEVERSPLCHIPQDKYSADTAADTLGLKLAFCLVKLLTLSYGIMSACGCQHTA